MKKPAETDHAIHAHLRERWSPRAFASTPVEPAALRSLLEAARWSPSCFNEQPWRFIVAPHGQPGHEALVGCLTEKNQSWAGRAPLLILAVARREFTKSGKPNRHALHDVGQAVAAMTVQATSLGLYVHQMAGFSVDSAREAFGIPETFEPDVAIAVGFPGDPDTLPEDLREAERSARSRKPHAEFAFAGRWGEPL